jgi:hypothetical protein
VIVGPAPNGDFQVYGTDTVFEAEWAPVYSGLLDQFGRPLYHPPDQRVFGFVSAKTK